MGVQRGYTVGLGGDAHVVVASSRPVQEPGLAPGADEAVDDEAVLGCDDPAPAARSKPENRWCEATGLASEAAGLVDGVGRTDRSGWA